MARCAAGVVVSPAKPSGHGWIGHLESAYNAPCGAGQEQQSGSVPPERSGAIGGGFESEGSVIRWRWPRLPSWFRDTGRGSIHDLLAQNDGQLVTGGWHSNLRFWRAGREVSSPIRTQQGPTRILQQLQSGACGGPNGRVARCRPVSG
jgi:hypothetical protein